MTIIRVIKAFFLFNLFLIVVLSGFSQQYFSIGSEKCGLAFGNPPLYHGLRFNFIDKEYAEHQNGLMISAQNKVKSFNGVNLSVITKNEIFNRTIQNTPKYSNGLNLSLININGSHNGLQLGLYNQSWSYKGNGILIGLINSHVFDNRCGCPGQHTGLQLGLINIGISTKGMRIGLFNLMGSSSISIGLLNIDHVAGIQIGVFNYERNDKGIQIGLLNYKKSNKPIFRLIPLINI